MQNLQIKNILVPVDFSDMSVPAIRLAKKFANQFHATVHLLHVQEVLCPSPFTAVPIGMPAAVPDWSHTLAQQMGARLLQDLRELALHSGLSPDKCYVENGAPIFDQISYCAREIGADLIVTATHGYGGLKHLVLGSTAERLVQHSSRPVVVARQDTLPARTEMKRILVPVDFSDCSMAGLTYAIELAETFAAEITVVHVVDFGSALTADGYAMYDLTRYKELAREQAERDMKRFLKPVHFGHVKFQTTVIADLFVDALNSAIADTNADLVVTSTHGRTGLKHVLVGSTAELIVRRANCPVMVVPSHPELRDKNAVGEHRSRRAALARPDVSSIKTERFSKRLAKITRHPFPERRKTNKFRETHLVH